MSVDNIICRRWRWNNYCAQLDGLTLRGSSREAAILFDRYRRLEADLGRADRPEGHRCFERVSYGNVVYFPGARVSRRDVCCGEGCCHF